MNLIDINRYIKILGKKYWYCIFFFFYIIWPHCVVNKKIIPVILRVIKLQSSKILFFMSYKKQIRFEQNQL